MGHIVPADFDTTWATYTEEFRALRLPALLVAMMGNLTVLAIIAIKGHESRAVRRLGIGLGLSGIAVIMRFTMIDAWKFGFHFYIYLGVVEVLPTLLIVWYELTWPRPPLVKTAWYPPAAVAP